LAIDPNWAVCPSTLGHPTNIKGNKLPGAPDYKFSAGVSSTLLRSAK
jgi:hypothetical protein